MRSLVLTWVLLLGPSLVQSKRFQPNWDSIDSRPLPDWYDKAKIGIFCHFGVFSVPSFVDEWFWNWWVVQKNPAITRFMARNYKPGFTYPEFANQFTAELFDAQQWAELFKKSGAKYFVLTTKHHEGFTLWPSKYSFNWNSFDIGPRRDIVGELEKAVRGVGLRFGTYFSLMEWFHPLYMLEKNTSFTTNRFVQLKIRPQMEELVTNYKPDIFWSDGDAEALDTYWDSVGFLAWLYNDSPVAQEIVVNDRWGLGTVNKHGGFYVGPDRNNLHKLQSHKWENAMTIDKKSWGYRREADLQDYMSIESLLSELVSTVSCGGNLLINVGPNHYGRIGPIFESRLTAMGEWLAVNGEAIYESKPWKCQNDTVSPDVWYTLRDTHVYGLVLKWPAGGFTEFGCVKSSQVKSVQMLGSDASLIVEKGLVGSIVHFPQWNPLQKAKHVFTFKFNLS